MTHTQGATATRKPMSGPLVLASLATLACALWGSAIPVIRFGYKQLEIASGDTGSQLLFAGIRFFLAGLAVTLAHAAASPDARRLPDRGELSAALQLSVFQTFGQYLFNYIGYAHASGVSSSLLQGLSVFIALLISSVIFRMERLTARKVAGCVIGFAGIVVSTGGAGSTHFSFIGEGMVLISLVMASMSTVLMARKSQRFNPVLLCGWQFMIGGLGLIAVALALGGRVDFVGHPAGLLQLGWLVMVSAVAYGVWSLLLRDNDVSRVAVFEFEIPVFGVLISLLLLGAEGTTVGWATVAALVLVTIGILMVESSPKANADAGAEESATEPAYSRNSA